jgi:hypothetical protein
MLLCYLVGDRAAILALAAHPRAWIFGLLFVLSAGFAREYDGEDLVHDPWVLLLPLGASVVSSFLLYLVLYGVRVLRLSRGRTFFAAYRSFLNLFWLTAPVAWLYAIPYERLLDSVTATKANLMTLALVATWRVALMVRVAVVLFDMRVSVAFFRVMAYADGVALLALVFSPFPIIEVMGGVRLTQTESAVRGAAQLVCCLGGLSFLVWLGVAIATIGDHSRWQLETHSRGVLQVSLPVMALAFVSLAVWFVFLPFTQPEQQLRRQVESAFRNDEIAKGLALMSEHDPGDFPPHWEPPPRFLKGDRQSLLLDICKEIPRSNPQMWVRQRFLMRLKVYLETGSFRGYEKEIASVLNDLPEAKAILSELKNTSDNSWILESLDAYLRPELQSTKIRGGG